MGRKIKLNWLAFVLAIFLATPAFAMIPRGFYADCYHYTVTACGGGTCATSECDQCDYYMNGVYTGSDGACY